MSRTLLGAEEKGLLRQTIAAISKSGMNTAGTRAVRKTVSKQITKLPRERVLALAHALLEEAPLGRFVAYELVEHHSVTMQSIDVGEVEALGEGMDGWADVDMFSILVAGPAWRSGRIQDAVIAKWAKSDDRWWRRAALVSTVPLNSKDCGGKGDVARTLAICRLLLSDRDDMVVKAMSWALRALAKPAPESVQRFLSENRSELAPRVIREAGNKLATGLKNPRRG